MRVLGINGDWGVKAIKCKDSVDSNKQYHIVSLYCTKVLKFKYYLSNLIKSFHFCFLKKNIASSPSSSEKMFPFLFDAKILNNPVIS